MNEEIIQRLEHLKQRINLLQASVDSLAISVCQLLVGQSLQLTADVNPPLSEEQRRDLLRMQLDAYRTNRDRASSKLSEFPFLPPDTPKT